METGVLAKIEIIYLQLVWKYVFSAQLISTPFLPIIRNWAKEVKKKIPRKRDDNFISLNIVGHNLK